MIDRVLHDRDDFPIFPKRSPNNASHQAATLAHFDMRNERRDSFYRPNPPLVDAENKARTRPYYGLSGMCEGVLLG
jgi:hypothetical protein